jgi:uroporphyrin-III C-methyltransferase
VNGKVMLVGAGPGDPELLTLRAWKAIKHADALLYDELISPEILELAPQSAQLHNVGKRCGHKKVTQEEINFLMVSLAGMGQQVVRLKSGDPLIFGRAGEEIEALRRAGIQCEIVPGVTSAFGAAASAAIPLTHRDIASTLIVVTAQHASSNTSQEWRNLISTRATLAIYMPGHNYSALSQRLESAGLPADTPCALVSQATQPGHRTLLSTVGGLPNEPALPAPCLLIVGEVVRLAESWRSENLGEVRRPNNGSRDILGTLLQSGSVVQRKEQTV